MREKLLHGPTWVVAVMESTKVGTVEQLRFSRRPWRRNKGAKRLKKSLLKLTFDSLSSLKSNRDRSCPAAADATLSPESETLSEETEQKIKVILNN